MKASWTWLMARVLSPRLPAALTIALTALWIASAWNGVEWQAHGSNRWILTYGGLGIDQLAAERAIHHALLSRDFSSKDAASEKRRREYLPDIGSGGVVHAGDWQLEVAGVPAGMSLLPTWGNVTGYAWWFVPLWPLAVVTGIWWWRWRAIERKYEQSRPPTNFKGARCRRCGYDLSGAVQDHLVCSECGSTLSRATVVFPKEQAPRLVAFLVGGVSIVLRYVLLLPALLALAVWILSLNSIGFELYRLGQPERGAWSRGGWYERTWVIWDSTPPPTPRGTLLPFRRLPLENQYTWLGVTIQFHKETQGSTGGNWTVGLAGGSQRVWSWFLIRLWVIAAFFCGVVALAWGVHLYRWLNRITAT